jgi:glycosyltransferase involved in cell wall biosynthesis
MDRKASRLDIAAPEARLSVVIPAFNEAEGITAALSDLCASFPDAEIIVVDDGSTDGTAEAAAAFSQVTVIQHPFNRGYGAALKAGMSVATREFVAWFDADNEHRASDLNAMLEIIIGRNVTAVVAQRRFCGSSPLRGWGKSAIRMLARSFDFRGGRDINCGLRIFHRDVITRYAMLLPNGYSASITSTMILLERGYPVAYHPIELNPRIGESKVRVRDGFLALMLVLRMIMLFAPLRIFLRAGMALIAIGLAYGVLTAVAAGRGIPSAAVVAMLAGVMLCLFGLVADQLSQMRLAQYDQPIFRYHAKPRHPETALPEQSRVPISRGAAGRFPAS